VFTWKGACSTAYTCLTGLPSHAMLLDDALHRPVFPAASTWLHSMILPCRYCHADTDSLGSTPADLSR
jgi:hypothetical protein